MSDLYKCVITPNVRTIELRSLPVVVKPGHHWIVDGEGKKPDVVVLAPGTQIIESFTMGLEGQRIVNETLIAGVGTIMGPLPAPGPDGTIRVEMPRGELLSDDLVKRARQLGIECDLDKK